MAQESFKRKLTTIFSADAVGYSTLMESDEGATVKTITAYRKTMTDLITQHRGRVIDSSGDNLLAEFGSVVDAVQCAVAIQKELQSRNDHLPEDRRMAFRIGINLGDVIQEGTRIYGDGVNIAARLEGLAEPGGICISRTAFDQIAAKLPYGYDFIGEQSVKNIKRPVGAYRVSLEPRVFDAKKRVPKYKELLQRKSYRAVIIAVIVISAALWIWPFPWQQSAIETASVEKMAFALPEKPSIVVLPFASLKDDPEHNLISDALTGDIISALSHESELFVIDRHSSFTYKGKALKIQTVAEELGVRYVLEGSVLKSEEQIRITAQLIDAISGEHVWTERYDRPFTDLFELEDDITFSIISNIQGEILEPSGTVPREGATNSLEAWLLFEQGQKEGRVQTKDGTYRAKELFERALEKDPDFVGALVGLGWKEWQIGLKGYSDSPEESLQRAEEIARRANELYPRSTGAKGLMIGIHMTNREFPEALALARKSVEINPNNAESQAILAWILLANVQPEESIKQFEKAMRLDPYYPPWMLNVMIRAYVLGGKYDEAQKAIRQQLDRNPGNFFNGQAHLNLAVVYSNIGEQEKAKAELAMALDVFPKMTLGFIHREVDCSDETFVAEYFDTLAKLGLPE